MSRSCLSWLLLALLATQSQAAHSLLWGRDGDLWDPHGRLPDFSHAGYHEGSRTRFVHDLTMSLCTGNVCSSGRGTDLCLDHHERVPYANLHQAQLTQRQAGSAPLDPTPFHPRTHVSIRGSQWIINGQPVLRGTRLEGLLPNVRMVNATFEDRRQPEFDAAANTASFLTALPQYIASGVRAFTLNLQGGMPGYEGALNSAFSPDGSLLPAYTRRVQKVIEACDQAGAVVILGCFYQRQDQVLRDEQAVRQAVVAAARWVQTRGFRNVLLEISNEFDHGGYNHPLLRSVAGQCELIELARKTTPGLLVSTSGLGHGRYPQALAETADFFLIHFNGTKLQNITDRIRSLQAYRKPIVCNEDDRTGAAAVAALQASTSARASYGLMLKEINQFAPFSFEGTADDPAFYRALADLAKPLP